MLCYVDCLPCKITQYLRRPLRGSARIWEAAAWDPEGGCSRQGMTGALGMLHDLSGQPSHNAPPAAELTVLGTVVVWGATRSDILGPWVRQQQSQRLSSHVRVQEMQERA